ncbi:hypothetical protein [Arcobacter sp. LA11]|uniref:hypothetical protein n=1 Tax=Arcobacter sp. LA11 TaxID=1898176 RepID=UPI001160A2B9|nr:hypothetical protein [Arcobacter sp. LA11]
MNKDLLKEYLKDAGFDYHTKKLKQAEYAKNIVFKGKNRTYTLEEVNDYKRKTKPRLVNNESSSVHRHIMDNHKLAIFQIRTINPKFNIPSNVLSVKEIDRHLKLQYQQFMNYFDYMNNFKIDGNRLNKQYVWILELSKALNIHSNSIDVLESKSDLEHYLKSIIYSKNKNNIGKIQLIITEYTLKHLERLFKDLKIRVKNKYIQLSLKKIGEKFYIKGMGGKVEEGIYFKLLTKEKNSKLKLIKYFYKNILKERKQKPTKEHFIFGRLGFRIKQFSKDFFNRKVKKYILYRTNNKLFSMIKNKNKDIQLTPSIKDLKTFLFYSASLFRKQFLRYENYENMKFVYYLKNKKFDTKWVEIVNLNTYEKGGFLESFSSNGDIYREEDFLGKYDRNIKQFFKELTIKNILTRDSFLENYKSKEFYMKRLISKLWVGYLEYLHYCVRRIGLNEYMEELIRNKCRLSIRVDIFENF